MAKSIGLAFSPEPDFSRTAALIGDPARAAMLCALFDGGEMTASELACRAGVAPNVASAHLAKLRDGGLLTMRPEGRQRLFRIANENVSQALEALTAISEPARIVSLSQSRISAELQAARSCYDHLAGRLGVAVTDALVSRAFIAPSGGRAFELSPKGAEFFSHLGIDVGGLRAQRRAFARQCIDWSERRPHLAGALGAALHHAFIANRWIERNASNRAVRLTPAGQSWLESVLYVDLG
jgi:DNA-binding transcriptional ArsR family regulator